ncbi:MAG: 50S ribosomal protein L29 [Planctomycetes bacterium]|nr:50S ribosomal protein L29 [Planctomycetota bacterium]
MKIKDLRGQRDSELEFELDRLQKALFDARFKSATETAAQPGRIRENRRQIARIRTLLQERKTHIRGAQSR